MLDPGDHLHASIHCCDDDDDDDGVCFESDSYIIVNGNIWTLVFASILQRQQRLQKERLMNDFSAALNNFQAVQRRVSEKEKETVARARAGSRISVSIYRSFVLL